MTSAVKYIPVSKTVHTLIYGFLCPCIYPCMQAEKLIPWSREKNRAKVDYLCLLHFTALLIQFNMLHGADQKITTQIILIKDASKPVSIDEKKSLVSEVDGKCIYFFSAYSY